MTPGDKIQTKVTPPTVQIDSRSPAADCVDVVHDAEEDLTSIAMQIEDGEWDGALESLEEIIGNLVALRDAILTAQQQKR